MPVGAVPLAGMHNVANVLAAFALGDAIGLRVGAMASAVEAYVGLPHRCETVAVRGGVRWINDSKGTNVGAAVAAIEGIGAQGPVVLIAGGLAKGADFSPLRRPAGRHVRCAVLIGRDAARLEAALGGCTEVTHVPDLAAAVDIAARPPATATACCSPPHARASTCSRTSKPAERRFGGWCSAGPRHERDERTAGAAAGPGGRPHGVRLALRRRARSRGGGAGRDRPGHGGVRIHVDRGAGVRRSAHFFWRQSMHVAVAAAAWCSPRGSRYGSGSVPGPPSCSSRWRCSSWCWCPRSGERSTAAPDGSGSARSTCSRRSSRSWLSSSTSRATSCGGRKRSGSRGTGRSSRWRCWWRFPCCSSSSRITARSSSCAPPCSPCCFWQEFPWSASRRWRAPPRSR